MCQCFPFERSLSVKCVCPTGRHTDGEERASARLPATPTLKGAESCGTGRRGERSGAIGQRKCSNRACPLKTDSLRPRSIRELPNTRSLQEPDRSCGSSAPGRPERCL